jgi:hypothetical protein
VCWFSCYAEHWHRYLLDYQCYGGFSSQRSKVEYVCEVLMRVYDHVHSFIADGDALPVAIV